MADAEKIELAFEVVPSKRIDDPEDEEEWEKALEQYGQIFPSQPLIIEEEQNFSVRAHGLNDCVEYVTKINWTATYD